MSLIMVLVVGFGIKHMQPVWVQFLLMGMAAVTLVVSSTNAAYLARAGQKDVPYTEELPVVREAVALAPSVSAHSLCLRSRFGTAAAILRASRALFRRTRGSPTITGRRIDVLAGGLRPPARTLRLPRAPRPRCALHGSVDGKQNGIVKFHHGAILIKVSDNAAGIPRRISGRLIRPQRHFAMG